jgi:hypothetical protein
MVKDESNRHPHEVQANVPQRHRLTAYNLLSAKSACKHFASNWRRVQPLLKKAIVLCQSIVTTSEKVLALTGTTALWCTSKNEQSISLIDARLFALPTHRRQSLSQSFKRLPIAGPAIIQTGPLSLIGLYRI